MRAEAETSVNLLTRRFRPALMAFFLRRIGDHTEAEDLTQEILTRMAERGAAIDEARPDAYVFQMAANLLRDRARRRTVRARYLAGQGAIEAAFTEERDPGRVLQGRESLASVVATLKELPERTRTIFILFRLEHMKQREIADMLGLSVRAVEGHVIRASAHLRERLRAEP